MGEIFVNYWFYFNWLNGDISIYNWSDEKLLTNAWHERIWIYFTILYLIFAGIYVYPVLTLFKFSTFTITALEENSQIEFADAIRNLKNSFTYVGVLTAISIGIYVIMFIFSFLLKSMF